MANKHDADRAILHFLPPPTQSGFFTLRSIHGASRQFNDQADIVRLYVSLVSRFATAKLAASLTSGYDDISFLQIRLGGYRLQFATARVGSVSGIDIHMERPKAKGAMIPRGISQGKHFPAAMSAGKAVIKFREAFLFHKLQSVSFLIFDFEGGISRHMR